MKKKMLKVPFEVWNSGVLLKVDTDAGMVKMLLSTHCPRTMIKSQLVQQEETLNKNQSCFLSTRFSIEGKNFGPLPLYSIEITPVWDQVEGILGMDFLSQHVIYIDYEKKELYIGYSLKDTCTSLPVKFSSCNRPIIQSQIGEKTFSFILDTGSAFLLSLNEKTLKSINAKELSSVNFSNIKDESHRAKSFHIQEIKIGNLVFSNIKAIEEKNEFSKNTSFNPKKKQSANNFIGRSILEKTNLLLDFPHKKLWQIGSLDSLKEAGYDPNKMIQVPFELDKYGISVEASCEIGKLRLSLDTGSSCTAIKSSLLQEAELSRDGDVSFYWSDKFEMNKKNFGGFRIYGLDIFSTRPEIDGVLGMNFLRHHIVYIDYQKKMLYIAAPK